MDDQANNKIKLRTDYVSRSSLKSGNQTVFLLYV